MNFHQAYTRSERAWRNQFFFVALSRISSLHVFVECKKIAIARGAQDLCNLINAPKEKHSLTSVILFRRSSDAPTTLNASMFSCVCVSLAVCWLSLLLLVFCCFIPPPPSILFTYVVSWHSDTMRMSADHHAVSKGVQHENYDYAKCILCYYCI